MRSYEWLGCRAGATCPFYHPEALPNEPLKEPIPSSTVESRNYQAPPVHPSQVILKPVSTLQSSNPREFQLQQLRRRFAPSESADPDATTLRFKLAPSDPDFPFELTALSCVLRVPAEYPAQDGTLPTLRITNEEMERGFQANVERGFEELARARAKDQTLLGLMNALDRRLEALLAGRKTETITLVANAGVPNSRASASAPKAPASNFIPEKAPIRPSLERSTDSYTPEQRATASARREAEARQLEARLGRLPRFAKSADGVAYTVPLEPVHRADLPVPLQPVQTIQLFVPLLYPLLPCRIRLQGVSREGAQATERAFEKHAKELPQMSLIGHVNHLATSMHVLAQQDQELDEEEERLYATLATLDVSDDDEEASANDLRGDGEEGKSHIHVIPRPPEWNVGPSGAAATENDSETTDDEAVAESEDDDVAQGPTNQASSSTTERGVAVSFPALELHGIELLELSALSLTVKCERCKDTLDVHNLRHRDMASGTRSESCKKCASVLSIGIISCSISSCRYTWNTKLRTCRVSKGIPTRTLDTRRVSRS